MASLKDGIMLSTTNSTYKGSYSEVLRGDGKYNILDWGQTVHSGCPDRIVGGLLSDNGPVSGLNYQADGIKKYYTFDVANLIVSRIKISTTSANSDLGVLFAGAQSDNGNTLYTDSAFTYNPSTSKCTIKDLSVSTNVAIGGNITSVGNIAMTDLKQITRKAASVSWKNGREGAVLKVTNADGYSTILSLKTTSGSWEIGHYTASSYADLLLFSYVTDANYSSTAANSNTTTSLIKFTTGSGIIANAFTKSGSSDKYVLLGGGSHTLISGLSVNYATTAGSAKASDVYSWAKASTKPSYSWSEITNKPNSMPASDVSAWAKAASKPLYSWSEITSKPTLIPVTDLALQTNIANIKDLGWYKSKTDGDSNTMVNSPFTTSYALLNIPLYESGNDLRRARIAIEANGNIKVSNDRGSSGTAETWKTVAFTSNIPTSLPASDVYLWAKASTKPSYSWSEINNKPSLLLTSDIAAWAKASTKPSYTLAEITDKIVSTNEFNIVNDGFSNVLWFNYRPSNGETKSTNITSYIMGNGSKGLASVTASSFIKSGSSDSYVLLGAGGQKALSDIMNYNNLSNKPTIPSLSGYATLTWVNGRGFITSLDSITFLDGTNTIDVDLGDTVNILGGDGISISTSDATGDKTINVSLSVATSSTYGGIKLGYTQSGKNYPVLLSNGKAYVNVPWTSSTSTDTKNTAGSTNSTSKLFLIGATSQASSATTNSNSSVYATNGVLYSDGAVFSGDLDMGTDHKITHAYAYTLYLGDVDSNSGWVKILDMASCDGEDYWKIMTSGAARFTNLAIGVSSSTSDPSDGDVLVAGDVTAAGFYQQSDINLKTNITQISNSDLEKISKVNLKSYTYKSDNVKRYGVIAQELEKIGLDSLVTEGLYKTVDYISLLILKIKYLEEEIKKLKYGNC